MVLNALLKEPSSRFEYRQVENMIFERIRNGQLKPGEKLDRIDLLAEKWKVSPTTVSHSLQRLAAKGIVVRKRRAGTYVNPNVQQLNAGPVESSSSVAFVSFDNRFPEVSPVLEGIQQVAHENGLDVVLGSTNGTSERLNEVILRYANNSPYGMALTLSPKGRLNLDLLNILQRNKVPVVSIYYRIPATNWPIVDGDLDEVLRLAVRHLCQIGRRRIAYVSCTAEPANVDDDYKIFHYSFMNALYDVGVSFDRDLQLSLAAPSSFDAIRRNDVQWVDTIKNWLTKHNDVDALCCTYDRIAWTAIRALEQMGKKVPQDVAVTGVGNLAELYGFSEGGLTTVDVNGREIGVQACRLLIDMRSGKEIKPDMIVKVKGKLIVGRSTVDVTANTAK